MNTKPQEPKSVQFAGRTLTISYKPKTLRTMLNVESMRAALMESIKDKKVTGVEFFYYYNIYPMLFVCTEAEDGLDIPTADQALDSEDQEGAGAWYEAAQAVNPHLFEIQPAQADESPEATEERLKKKRRRNRRSLQPAE